MTPATVLTLDDGTRQGCCPLCGQHGDTPGPYVEPLSSDDDVTRFILQHQAVRS